MSDIEIKSPYFSMRVHIGEMTTVKQLGIKTRSLEVTFGNMETVEIRDKEDIASVIKSTPLAKKVWDEWEAITKEGHDRGYKFIEDAAQ